MDFTRVLISQTQSLQFWNTYLYAMISNGQIWFTLILSTIIFYVSLLPLLWWIIDSYGINAKEPYAVMNCPLYVVIVVICRQSCWLQVYHRNFISCMHTYACIPLVYARKIFSQHDLYFWNSSHFSFLPPPFSTYHACLISHSGFDI